MTSAIYTRLLELLPSQPILTGVVTAAYADGTALITYQGGGTQRLRNPLGSVVGADVYVQGDAVIGAAPSLPYGLIEI